MSYDLFLNVCIWKVITNSSSVKFSSDITKLTRCNVFKKVGIPVEWKSMTRKENGELAQCITDIAQFLDMCINYTPKLIHTDVSPFSAHLYYNLNH